MENHPSYELETPYPYLEDALDIDQKTFDSMFKLFTKIAEHWQLELPKSGQESQLLVFMQNRMKLNLSYYAEYKNAVCVIKEMTQQLGEEQAYIKLLTDPAAAITPPTTRLARARQKVSNEFITLALSIGGFKTFGAKNALGFIGGANIKDQTPYRDYQGVDNAK